MSAATQVDLMLQQCAQLPAAVRGDGETMRPAASWRKRSEAAGLPTRVLCGPAALEEVASHESVDAVMAAIVGAAGLASCLAAARAGKRLLLANKEALVVGRRAVPGAR